MTCPRCRQPATLAGTNWRCDTHGNIVRTPDHRLAGVSVSGTDTGSKAHAHCVCGHTETAPTLYEASDLVMDHAAGAHVRDPATPGPTRTPAPTP